MKALSLKQPWAFLVANGWKDIENRTWNTKFRGTFLIHAAKGMTKAYYNWAVNRAQISGLAITIPHPSELLFGGLIGKARLVEVISPCVKDPDAYDDAACECGHRWHFGPQYGYVLKDACTIPFRPLTGRLQFFEVLT